MESTIATAPKTTTFQFRINPKIRERAESIYSDCGLTLTDAINIFIQQSINVEGLPFVVTTKSKSAKFEQAGKYILGGKRSIAILRTEAATVSATRILDTRTDYITTIFGD